MSEITHDTHIRRKVNLLDAEVDGEIVALDVEGGDCYGFNVVASAIWNLLIDTTSISEICQHLSKEFDVDGDVCRDEVGEFVRRLRDDGLIIIDKSSVVR